MKKQISLLLIFALLSALLAGCGSAIPAPAAPEPPAPTEAPTPTPTPELTPEPTQEPTPEPAPDFDTAALHPMLWKVTDPEGHSLYLFGTIHVGDERVQAVLDKVRPYLVACDALAVEFDLVAYESDLAAAMADYQQFLYSDGSSVRDHMPEDLYERCAELLRQANAYSPMLDMYNLGMWANLTETAALMVCSKLDPEMGMDRMLIALAYAIEIPVLSIESASFQMGLLNSFPDELNLLMIRETLENLDSYGESIDELFEAWLSGDYDRVLALVSEEDDSADYTEEELQMMEAYNKAMLEDRNRGMAQAALSYLESGDTVFLAVGTAHMVDDLGLVQLLTDAGCTVERVDY